MTEYKGFKIVPDGTMGYFTIKQPGKGLTPVELRGMFTSPTVAMKAIDRYVPKRGAKKKDAETTTTTEL